MLHVRLDQFWKKIFEKFLKNFVLDKNWTKAINKQDREKLL